MSTDRGPNYYPPGGHDWVAPDVIRRESAHNNALIAEKYAHDVMRTRQQCYSKLLAHHALQDNVGWAIFDTAEDEGAVATLGEREILLMSVFQIRPEDDEENPIPDLRFITNEPLTINDETYYITEDITIDRDGDAQYLMDCVLTKSASDEQSLDEASAIIMRSLSPIFIVTNGDTLHISQNLQAVTPIFVVSDPACKLESATPFGNPLVMADKIFALEKAQELLQTIAHLEPSAHLPPDK